MLLVIFVRPLNTVVIKRLKLYIVMVNDQEQFYCKLATKPRNLESDMSHPKRFYIHIYRNSFLFYLFLNKCI